MNLIKIRGLQPIGDLDHCEAMGFDSVKSGADEKNCHFAIFGTREGMMAWERGKRRAEEEES